MAQDATTASLETKARFARGMGAAVTLLDVLKTLAVLIMICDHVGAYFFPDVPLYRVIGRFGLPVWFFMMGYARGRHIPWQLWGGGLFLIAIDLVTCQAVLPLNALVSMVFIRWSLDFFDRWFLQKFETAFALIIGLVLTVLTPVNPFEYGAIGLLLAFSGLKARQAPGKNWFFHGFVFLLTVAVQIIDFESTLMESILMVAGAGSIYMILLMLYRLPRHVGINPSSWWAAGLRLGGRYTLEIYVLHIALFCIVAFFLYPDARACFQLMPVK